MNQTAVEAARQYLLLKAIVNLDVTLNTAAFRAGMGKLAKAELPPAWALCEMTSEISGTRNMVERVYGETLVRKRMTMCLGRNTEEESQVFEWLYERWGQQIWPSGIPKDLATAQALLGKTKARLERKPITSSSVG